MMVEKPLRYFENAIQAAYGAEAVLTGIEPVVCVLDTVSRWEGEVLVFALVDHPTATTCYAWETHGKVSTELHESPVDSAQAAVQRVLSRETR